MMTTMTGRRAAGQRALLVGLSRAHQTVAAATVVERMGYRGDASRVVSAAYREGLIVREEGHLCLTDAGRDLLAEELALGPDDGDAEILRREYAWCQRALRRANPDEADVVDGFFVGEALSDAVLELELDERGDWDAASWATMLRRTDETGRCRLWTR